MPIVHFINSSIIAYAYFSFSLECSTLREIQWWVVLIHGAKQNGKLEATKYLLSQFNFKQLYTCTCENLKLVKVVGKDDYNKRKGKCIRFTIDFYKAFYFTNETTLHDFIKSMAT